MKKDLTIYDVQVNCARLSKEKIENLARIVEERGGVIWSDKEALIKDDELIYFRFNTTDLEFAIWSKCSDKQPISYARFVELFDKKELEVGKWYKYSVGENDFIKFNFSGKIGNFTQSGFSVHNTWYDSELGLHNADKCIPMTEQEVSDLLFAEAKKRLGENWENAKIKTDSIGNECKNNALYDVFYDIIADRLWNKNGLIYEKGKWAELLVVESNVNSTSKPTHYKTKSGYDVIDISQDNNLNFNLGAICKYVIRAGKKLYPNMNELESYLADLEKAQDHLNREIEYVKKELK